MPPQKCTLRTLTARLSRTVQSIAPVSSAPPTRRQPVADEQSRGGSRCELLQFPTDRVSGGGVCSTRLRRTRTCIRRDASELMRSEGRFIFMYPDPENGFKVHNLNQFQYFYYTKWQFYFKAMRNCSGHMCECKPK